MYHRFVALNTDLRLEFTGVFSNLSVNPENLKEASLKKGRTLFLLTQNRAKSQITTIRVHVEI